MKLGVTQWTLDVKGVKGVARAAALGFHYLQLDAGNWSAWPEPLDSTLQKAYAEAAHMHNVELVGIGVNPLNEQSLLQETKKACSCIEHAIEAAAYLKVPLVYLPSFEASQMKRDEDIRLTAEVLCDMAGLASEHGITLASENTLGIAEQHTLLHYTAHPNVKIFFDTQNPSLHGHDAAALIRALAKRLANQIHLKDGSGGEMGNATLGQGNAGFDASAAALKELSEMPMLILENEYGVQAEQKVARDKAAVARLLFA